MLAFVPAEMLTEEQANESAREDSRPLCGGRRRGETRYRAPRPKIWLVSDSATPVAKHEPESLPDWRLVHERLVALGANRARLEHELCRWLCVAEQLAIHRHTAHGSLAEYADRTLGLTSRQVEERLRVGRALEQLPALDAALSAGAISFSTARELTRVAVPETEGAWLRWARGKRSHQIEDAVATRRPGDRPESRPDPALRKYRLHFEVRPETMALFRDLQARIRADLGERVDDDAFLNELARRALGGPTDEGRSSYQVAVMRCPDCGRTTIDAGGQSHLVDDAVAEMVKCDCQELGSVDPCPHVGAGPNRPDVAEAPECPQLGAVPAADDEVEVKEPGLAHERAVQSIPPAVRRRVLARDRHRCQVPGCRSHLYLDLHHTKPQAEGGTHDPDFLLTTCGCHHTAAHRGALVIRGSAPGGFHFEHADGTPYGGPLRPDVIDLSEQAFGALHKLGFPQTTARSLIDRALAAGPPNDLATLLQTALALS